MCPYEEDAEGNWLQIKTRHVTTEAKIKVTWPQAKAGGQPSDVSRGEEQILPWTLQGKEGRADI